VNKKSKNTSDIEALIFRPSKVSWGLQKSIIRLNPFVERMTFVLIIVVFLSGLLWSFLASKAVVVDSTGEIIPVSSPIPVMSKSVFTIKKILVKDNQELKKGDVVLESTRHLSDFEVTQIKSVFSRLNELLATEKNGSCMEVCFGELKVLSETGLDFQQKIDQNTDFYRELVELSKTLKDYSIQYRQLRSLPETMMSLNNELKITNKRIFEIERRKAKSILALEYEELQNKSINIQNQIKEKELNSKLMMDNARTNYEISLSKMPQAFKIYQDNTLVIAPIDGRVRFENIKGVGQIINNGDILFMITQASSDLWLKFQISESDVSKVKVGHELRIDLSSYPASEYGIQKAKVVEVRDKLPVENEQQKVPYFVGFAKLDRQYVEFRNKKYGLRIGMQGKVKIIVKHDRMLNIFIKKLFSIKDEYLGDLL
jgi:multidrug efflux pump subunit AcrA (membrane-fusion protein)